MFNYFNFNSYKHKKSNLFNLIAIFIILIIIIFFRAVIYFSGGTTSYVHLMYIPILLSVVIYGIKGGIVSSLIAGLLLGPNMPFVVNEGIMQDTKSWTFRIIMFILISSIFGILIDYINKMHKKENEKALIDIITSYPNANKLLDDLNLLINEKKHQIFTLIIFEYKNIDMINQYVSHEVGRKSFIELLRCAAGSFKPCNIYTVSTNKFVILIPNINSNEAMAMANRFIIETKKPMIVDTLPLSLIVGGGILSYPTHCNNTEEIFNKLEKVLTQLSKKQINITIYDNNLETESMLYYNTLVSMYFSLQNDMFHLVYQPKHNLKTNELDGVEALLRISHENNKNVSISQLITMAEDVGFINEITKWVILNVIRQLDKWNSMNLRLKVSINLSSIDLNDDSIINYTLSILEKYKVETSLIEFELTERSIIKDESKALSVIKQLRENNIKMSLDDYGTGHNSLSHLTNLSNYFDYIKIDKTFIDDINKKHNEVIIKGIIDTAHVLGIKTIAEGVETKKQLEILKRIDCDIIQGYYITKPLLPEELINYCLINNI